jgi:Leucine-rich repeat (LRR) protein
MRLNWLDLTQTGVQDFTPLDGMPLEICFLQMVRIGDLAFLKGAPLKQLTLFGCTELRNVPVLSGLRTLEVLGLPQNLPDLSTDDFAAVETLRNHPALKQISAYAPPNAKLATLQLKDDFWKNWDRDFAWALRLRKAGFAFTSNRLQDGTWELSLHEKPFSDLSLFAGANISALDLSGTQVTDLSPLKSMPLTELNLDSTPAENLAALRGLKLNRVSLMHTPVRDLSPLSGMPLEFLDLRGDQLTDLLPLATVPSLEQVVLPIHATDLEALRKLPNMKRLSFSATDEKPECTAEIFWKTWDGLPWARKLEAAGIDFTFQQSYDGYYHAQVHDPKLSDCSMFEGSNVRGLGFYNSGPVDLSALAQLPLVSLTLFQKQAKDLSVLRSPVLSKSLRQLRLVDSEGVADFYAPVAACVNLETFDAHGSGLANLSILKGMNLHTLKIGNTAVSDISLLAGMPLETVELNGSKVIDIAPLLKCPTLKSVLLPAEARDVDSLRAMTSIARISYDANGKDEPDKTAQQFWSANREGAWLTALRKTNLTYKTRLLKDGTWELTLDHQPISDLSILQGGKISRLYIASTPVSDLAPLRTMQIAYLRISNTKVTDLSPLKGLSITNITMSAVNVRDLTPLVGLPLRVLNMPECTQITDLSPLVQIKTLEAVVLPPNAKNIEVLRRHPTLKKIGYKLSGSAPLLNAEDFWAEYDRTGGKPATQPATQPTIDK